MKRKVLQDFFKRRSKFQVERVIYTDGACKKNGTKEAKAGCGVYFGKDDPQNISCSLPGSIQTNQRAELYACILALRECNNKDAITMHTDSAYVKNGITSWVNKWKKNGWKTSSRKSVKNKDLWIELDELYRPLCVTWKWVKGHSGDPGNDAADTLATRGSLK